MPRFKDLTYQTFGRLFVIERTTKTKFNNWKWWCHCECGNFTEVISGNLIRGHTVDCGCGAKQRLRDRSLGNKFSYKHGDYNNPNSPYTNWEHMMQRCYNRNHDSSKYYFEKGIQVCNEWKEYTEYKAWAICHGWHKGLVLDRIDPDEDYTPDNCEWVTPGENTRRAIYASKLRRV